MRKRMEWNEYWGNLIAERKLKQIIEEIAEV